MISMNEDDGSFASITGGVSPRPFVKVEQEPTEWAKVLDTSDMDDLDMGYLSAKECEVEYPGFFHNKLDAHIDAVRLREKDRPTVVLSSGHYRYDRDGVPISGAKLKCTCDFMKVYDSWAQMEENLPEECGNKKNNLDCPLYHGKMRAQYNKMNRRAGA